MVYGLSRMIVRLSSFASHGAGTRAQTTARPPRRPAEQTVAHLAVRAPATIKDLHQGLAHKRSTLTSILDRLAGRGFITREVGTADRRTFVITPTAKGRRVARRVHEHLTELERAVARRVTPADVSGFLNVITAVEEEARRRTERASGRGAREPRATVRARDRRTPSATRQPLP